MTINVPADISSPPARRIQEFQAIDAEQECPRDNKDSVGKQRLRDAHRQRSDHPAQGKLEDHLDLSAPRPFGWKSTF